MKQVELIDRIGSVLGGLERVGAALLGGSYGRREADEFSDVDVYVVIADAQDVSAAMTELTSSLPSIAPMLFHQVLPNARTINSITRDWLRFDLTVLSRAEVGYLARDQVQPLFDRLGVVDALAVQSLPAQSLRAEPLLATINEFIRVVGLSVVVNGRDDVVVAQTGTNLLRDMLIQIMLLENAPQPHRGVLSLKRQLSSAQFATLQGLPPLDATWPSVFRRTQALAEAFLPRARALAKKANATWPDDFERVTLAHVAEKLGLQIRHDH